MNELIMGGDIVRFLDMCVLIHELNVSDEMRAVFKICGATDEEMEVLSGLIERVNRKMREKRMELAWNTPLPNEWVN